MSAGDQSAPPSPTTPSRTPVSSTNLKSLQQRGDGRVEIEFLNSPTIYITESAVSPDVYQDWLASKSVGVYFNQHIAPYYRPRPKTPADDKPPAEPEPAQLTEEDVLVQAIAVDINRWLHGKGDGVLQYANFLDRVAEIAILIKEQTLPRAHDLVIKALETNDERLVDGGRICFKLPPES